MGERTYTVTLKVRRKFARKVNSTKYRDQVKRAVERALPDGWELAGASIGVKGKTPRQVTKATRDKKRTAERKAADMAKRTERRARIEIAKKREKEWREKFGGPLLPRHISEVQGHRLASILISERMTRWRVLDVTGASIDCWSPHWTQGTRPRMKATCMETQIEFSKTDWVPNDSDCRYLRKHGVAPTAVDGIYGQLLHDVAHVRHARTLGAEYDSVRMAKKEVHGKKFRLFLLNAYRKHFPDACTEQARSMDAIRAGL